LQLNLTDDISEKDEVSSKNKATLQNFITFGVSVKYYVVFKLFFSGPLRVFSKFFIRNIVTKAYTVSPYLYVS
jgi:hypothetical protein